MGTSATHELDTYGYGQDMPVGSVIRWMQYGWRWTAQRKNRGWRITNRRIGVYRDLFTWEQLCDHLMRRMVPKNLERFSSDDCLPPWLDRQVQMPVQIECRPTAPGRRPLIPAHRFPKLGAVGRRL